MNLEEEKTKLEKELFAKTKIKADASYDCKIIEVKIKKLTKLIEETQTLLSGEHTPKEKTLDKDI